MVLKDIIDHFKNYFGYVEDIESVILCLEENNFSLTETNEILHAILEWNEKKEQELKKSLNKSAPNNIDSISNENASNTQTHEISTTKKTQILNTNHYKQSIDACDDPDFITELLPSPYENNFENTIYSLLLSYYKEITCANQMLKDVKDSLEIEYLQKEINKAKKIIEIIKEYHIESTTQETIEQKQEKNALPILYLRNFSNIPYINVDIEDIGISDYSYLESIFTELSQGIISHEKKFVTYEKLRGISAIRKGDVRVIFARIDNTIIVLGALSKRFQNTAPYRELLKRRAKAFKEQKDSIKESINNENFIENNNYITEELFNKLTQQNPKQKVKKRNSNGTTN